MSGFPTQEHVEHVCNIGQGTDTCRYLTAGADGIECAKGTPLASLLDERVNSGTLGAHGDNCPGYTEQLEAQ